MTIAIIQHEDCDLHEAGDFHVEQPARVQVVRQALESYNFHEQVQFFSAPQATRAQLINAHAEAYVDWIFSIAPKKGTVEIDPDTAMNPHTLEAALRAAGSVPMAVDLIMQKSAQVAFCNVRPPGHHAEHQRAMGFCFFNNIAIGVLHALTHHQLKRVAIIDFDVHHGNGTQDIFQNDERVLLCSSFAHPFYPGYEPADDNTHILNVPLAAGTRGELFQAKVGSAWLQKLAEFQPEFIFFSAGFDAHVDDPIGNLGLTKTDYVWLTTQIAKIAQTYCAGRMVSVLEGGYNLNALAHCVPAHVNAMLGS